MIKSFLILNAFGQNLTEKYDGSDATAHILLMLLGAALIGFLLRHFIGFRKKEYIIEQNSSSSGFETTGDLAEQIERLRLEINRLKGETDESSQVSGSKSAIKKVGGQGGGSMKPKQETTTLGEISALASLKNDEVKNLGDLESNKTENEKSTQTSIKKKSSASDDLKVIEGIGPALEKMLNENQIFTYEQLASKTVSELDELLDKAGPRFRVHVPETWPEQAALLRDGKTDAFKALTEKLKGGRRL